MTNKEALKAKVALPAEDGMLDLALIDNDLEAGTLYSTANQESINKAAMQVLQGLKSTKSVTIGDFSHSIDANAVNERISFLSGETTTVKQPTISNATNLW